MPRLHLWPKILNLDGLKTKMAAFDILLKILDQAVSQDPQVVKFAEGKLKEWEEKPEFYKTLLVSNDKLDANQCLSCKTLTNVSASKDALFLKYVV